MSRFDEMLWVYGEVHRLAGLIVPHLPRLCERYKIHQLDSATPLTVFVFFEEMLKDVTGKVEPVITACIKCEEKNDLLADTKLRIDMAVKEEREACARTAEMDSLLTGWPLTRREHDRERAVKKLVARAIRARGNHDPNPHA